MKRTGMSNQNLFIENARIFFKNFGGAPTKFNPKGGKRTFCVAIEPEDAISLKKDGWNIKFLRPREEDDEPQAYLQVNVQYNENGRGPKAYTVTSRGKTLLTEQAVSILDWAEILKVDLIIRPYPWKVDGNTGIAGYLKELVAVLYESPLELKYTDDPDAPESAKDVILDPDDPYFQD